MPWQDSGLERAAGPVMTDSDCEGPPPTEAYAIDWPGRQHAAPRPRSRALLVVWSGLESQFANG